MGNGRYRKDRYTSSFSLKSKVEPSFKELVEKTYLLGSQLIISYPERGLLKNTKEELYKMLRRKFKKVDITHQIDLKHSSMGASKGYNKCSATELIFWAR